MGTSRFRVNSPSVIYETVDAETIIVNLDTGSYYDLNHVGAFILELVDGGAASDELSTSLMNRYRLDPDAAHSAVNGLLQELLAEEIIVSVDAGANGRGTPHGELTARADSGPFVIPTLNKHTDMQDLLLLDPVHEFDGEPPPQVKW